MTALVEAGIEDETLVVYASDHGDFVGNHGMVEKAAAGHNVYEDILNVPLILKYPGSIKGGWRTAELVSLVDVLPTLIEVLGLKVPARTHPMQGQSLAGLILKNESLNRAYLVSESWSQATVITTEHKLGIMLDPTNVHRSWDYRDFGDMFFDRVADPLEVKNGIDEPAYQPTISKLRSYFQAFTQEVPATGKTERLQKSD